MRGTACGPRVTPARSERTSRVHQSLELVRSSFGTFERRQEGQARRYKRGVAAIGRGNPLKAEAQGRYRHETRPEGLGRNKASRG
jgi:hypothetical protein